MAASAPPGDYSAPRLDHFFIFNSNFGPTEETEQEKLLFFYPTDETSGQQLTHVGLAEAMVNFSRTFSPEKPCEVVRTERQCHVYYECEPDFWMLMSVCHPQSTRMVKGRETVVYDNTFLDESVLSVVLRHSYAAFRLFHGTMTVLAEKYSAAALRESLDAFFRPHLATLDFSTLDLFEALDGIRFVPVARDAFLHATHCVFTVQNRHPQIHHTVLLFDGHLVWSGLPQQEMRVLYRYLIHTMPQETLVASTAHAVQRCFPPLATALAAARHGTPGSERLTETYLTGPDDLAGESITFNAPRVFVCGTEELHLVVYKFSRVTILLFVDPSVVTDISFYRGLRDTLHEEYPSVIQTLSDHYIPFVSNEDAFKYIYFNHMNLAFKTSLTKRPNVITQETMQVLQYIHTQFERSPDDIKEYCVKTKREGWVIGRKVAQREFYVIFDARNTSIAEVSASVRSLSHLFFHSAFVD